MTNKILVLISGTGTNLKAIIESIESNVINCEITCVISNKDNIKGLEIAKSAKIPTIVLPFNRKVQTREEYDDKLIEIILCKDFDFDFVVLAGWMHILSEKTINTISPKPIINLHPALANTFIGANAIEQTLESYKKDPENTKAGIMVHFVIPDVDKGQPIIQQEVKIFNTDTLESLTNRIKYFEKPLLLQAITILCNYLNDPTPQTYQQLYHKKKTYPTTQQININHGKVRDYWDTGYNVMAMYQTDRQSAFDREICQIPHKGLVLTALSSWWFNATRHIIPNHHLYSEQNLTLVRKAKVYPVEIVVRAFMTGTTKTSLWSHYKHHIIDNKETEFKYCGHTFKSGYKKNQILDKLYITPTTKGKMSDEPITAEEIIDKKIMIKEEWNYIAKKALELFQYGQQIANQNGYILVDTKYEFGRDEQTNTIMLVDELHTCDSSRYWRKDTYRSLFSQDKEPEKLDKDMIRDFVSKTTDPYDKSLSLPKIPKDMIKRVNQTYINFANEFLPEPIKQLHHQQQTHNQIIRKYFSQIHDQMVILLTDNTLTEKDIEIVQKEFTNKSIVTVSHRVSLTDKMRELNDILTKLNRTFRQINIVALSTNSLLSTMCALHSDYPVYTLQSLFISTSLFIPSSYPTGAPVSIVDTLPNLVMQIEKCYKKTSQLMFINK